MEGDRFLYAGIAAVPSLGAGISAYTFGYETLAFGVGLLGAVYLVISLLIASIVMLKLLSRPLRAAHHIATQYR